tara:strand:+ start:2850 stop:3923 length:1074 start_codon:yes stop_codon:yes gene_type:complete
MDNSDKANITNDTSISNDDNNKINDINNDIIVDNASNLDIKINNNIEDIPTKEINQDQEVTKVTEIVDSSSNSKLLNKNPVNENTINENTVNENTVNENTVVNDDITSSTKNKLVNNSNNNKQIVKDKYQKYIEICKKLFSEIKVHFKNLNSKLSILSNKVDKIKVLCSNLNNKKTLYNDDHINNLVFQANLISGDINYLSTIKKTFLNKFHNDIFNLANNIILFISSITNLEIDDNDKEKNHIIKKVTTIKKINDVNIKLIEVYLESILKNLSLVDDVCLNFTNYINKINNKINTEHFHCNNLNITLSNKKNNILLEFNKNRDSICRLLEYYANFTNHVEKQINNLKISDFCLNEV